MLTQSLPLGLLISPRSIPKPYAMFHSLEHLPWAATGRQVRFFIAIDKKEVISLSSCQLFISFFSISVFKNPHGTLLALSEL